MLQGGVIFYALVSFQWGSLEQRFLTLATHQNHLESVRKYWCLGLTSQRFWYTGWGSVWLSRLFMLLGDERLMLTVTDTDTGFSVLFYWLILNSFTFSLFALNLCQARSSSSCAWGIDQLNLMADSSIYSINLGCVYWCGAIEGHIDWAAYWLSAITLALILLYVFWYLHIKYE